MLFASGFWDNFILSIRVSADGGWELQVGAVFVLALFILGAWGLDWFEEDAKPGHTGSSTTDAK